MSEDQPDWARDVVGVLEVMKAGVDLATSIATFVKALPPPPPPPVVVRLPLPPIPGFYIGGTFHPLLCERCNASLRYATPDVQLNPSLAGPAGPYVECTVCGRSRRTHVGP